MKKLKNTLCTLIILLMLQAPIAIAHFLSPTTLLARTGKNICQHITLPLFTTVKNAGKKSTEFVIIKGGTYTINATLQEITTSAFPMSSLVFRTLTIFPLAIASMATSSVTALGTLGIKWSLAGINYCDRHIKN